MKGKLPLSSNWFYKSSLREQKSAPMPLLASRTKFPAKCFIWAKKKKRVHINSHAQVDSIAKSNLGMTIITITPILSL